MMPSKLILASASPRRRELIQLLNIPYTCISADCDESLEPCPPQEAVCILSERKARAALTQCTLEAGTVLIGADTVVAAEGFILGKPADDEEAFSMIRLLSGEKHSVYTGVTLISQEGIRTFAEETRVTVADLTDEEIYRYLATGEHRDKAGSYGIQGAFSIHVTEIQGDYNNVVGFPVARIYQELCTPGNISQKFDQTH